jgi:hypothetical protein
MRWPGLSNAAQIVLILIFSGALSPSLGQPPQSQLTNLPAVTNLSIPTYPRIPLLAHIQGVVKILVTTSGNRVSTFNSETGPPMLIASAKENLRTWEFEDNHPSAFTVEFDYRLEGPGECYSGPITTILQLPHKALISTNPVMFCDPPATITGKRHWWQFWK